MPARDYALPYLYKICILGDSRVFAERVAEMRRLLHEPARAQARSPWGRLIRMAADKLDAMARNANMDDAQRSLPRICALSSGAHGADILLALRDIGPSMPIPTQQACAEACAHVGNPQALEAMLDIVGPATAEKWLERLSLASRAAGHILLAQNLDERQLAIVENREIAAQSHAPIRTQTSSSSAPRL